MSTLRAGSDRSGRGPLRHRLEVLASASKEVLEVSAAADTVGRVEGGVGALKDELLQEFGDMGGLISDRDLVIS